MREVLRKLLHVSFGTAFILIALYLENMYGIGVVRNAVFVVLILTLLHNLLTVDVGVPLPLFKRFVRERERKGLHGGSTYLLGVLIALSFYPFDIALAAAAMLIYGDALAALIGQKWGRPWFRGKSKAGTLAMLTTSIIVGFFFVNSWQIVLVMAITATVIETLATYLDDNLMIPLFTGLAGWCLHLLGL